MPDIDKLSDTEQAELLRLLEQNEVGEVPTITFTVRVIGSKLPPRVLPPIYPTRWKGKAWWEALPLAKRKELAAQGAR